MLDFSEQLYGQNPQVCVCVNNSGDMYRLDLNNQVNQVLTFKYS